MGIEMGTLTCYLNMPKINKGNSWKEISDSSSATIGYVGSCDLQETSAILKNKDLLSKIRRGTDDIKAGRTISLSEYKQQLK